MRACLYLPAAALLAACATTPKAVVTELQETSAAGVVTTRIEGPAERLKTETLHGGIAVRLREYANQKERQAARERVLHTFTQRLEARGYRVVEDASRAGVVIEIDPSFYVYTNKFNARRVRLAEYEDSLAQGGGAKDPAEAPERQPDVLRVVAGAVGIATGIVTPSFGSVMITQGSTASHRLNQATFGLFGVGEKAPVRVLAADRARYERGEQEMKTLMRIRSGEVKLTRTVISTLPSDDPPFQIEALTAENWTRAIDSLAAPSSP